MSTRSLNKVMLIGNLTRDPELRYTSKGTAVCSFGLATNRSWITEQGEKKEDVSFHRAVAWDKLAEICSQLLFKGRRVYVEGRLQTRQWEDQSGGSRQTTEIIISEMMILDSRRSPEEGDEAETETSSPKIKTDQANQKKPDTKKSQADPAKQSEEEVDTSDIPF
ncbi:MAG: single-stranded DNA-binding protein [Candidatus Shapirobacteria bacterium]|nr:single-stranded DNA-binding protein [Candidatus Shapirobacteria bacterium]